MSLEIIKLSKRQPFDRIAFIGPMASGKTFLSNHLIETKNYHKVALADKLKSIVYDLYGVTGKDGPVRQILQEFADDAKKWDNDVFIKHFLLRVNYLENQDRYNSPKIVCDDLRFKREGEVLRKAGFTIIRVDASEKVRNERINKLYPNTDPKLHTHRSELEFPFIPFDYIVRSEDVTDLLDLDKLLDEDT